MNPSSSQSHEDQDWEMLSGSKSLTSEKDLQSIEGILSLKEKRGENKGEKEDWYTTIPPATPANTPEYAPNPPTYPSASLRRELSQSETSELFPILEVKEDTVDETRSVNEDNESSSGEYYFEYTPVDSDNEDPASVRTFNAVKDWICRIAFYIVVFSLVKWAASKVWEKLRGVRSGNESI